MNFKNLLRFLSLCILFGPIALGVRYRVYNVDDLYQYDNTKGPFKVELDKDGKDVVTDNKLYPIYAGDKIGFVVKACRRDGISQKLYSQIVYAETGEEVSSIHKEWLGDTKHCDLDNGFKVIFSTHKDWLPGSYIIYRQTYICGGSVIFSCQEKELPSILFDIAVKN